MPAFLKVNYPNSVITVALHDYVVKWDQGRLLGGGTVFAAPGLNYFQLDLRYWEIIPGSNDTFECYPRTEKDVLFIIKEGEQASSRRAIGYEKFANADQDGYVAFLKEGRNQLVLSSDYNVYYQPVHDPAKGQTFVAMLAVRKAS